MQRRRAVQHNGVVFYNPFEHVPNHGFHFFYRALCVLYVVADIVLHEFFHNERLEQFDCHFLGQTALIEFEFGAYDYNRTTGIVDALSEQVLTESSLFAAEHTRERFEFSVARAGNGFAAPAVIDKRVNRFLQHSLFVSDDYFGRAEFHQFL